MDKHTTDFIDAAEGGRPVFVTEVRKKYNTLDLDQSFALRLVFAKIGGGEKTFYLRLPRFLNYPEAGGKFVTGFFLAEMYNILSTMGAQSAALGNPERADEAESLVRDFNHAFGAARPRHQRTGYGKCLSVMERMLASLYPGQGKGGFVLAPGDGAAEPPPPRPPKKGGAADVFRQAAEGLGGKSFLGIDIGGTDVKAALVDDGRLIALKEFDWNPAAFTGAEQMIQPLVDLVRLMGFAAAVRRKTGAAATIAPLIEKALGREAGVADIAQAVTAANAAAGKDAGALFDALGISFPDVVVADRIIGGESPKTKGMRAALGEDFDAAFAKLTNLCDILRPLVKPGGQVGIVNDGPMAAFTAGVEMAASRPETVAEGVFAHTLGTDLGSGWVDETGRVPDMPLEVYNMIIDLGSWPERAFEPEDVRSIANVNTGLFGTVQKFANQSGVFRLALKYFPAERPDLLREIREAGYVAEGPNGGLFVPTSPKDMRKPFLEHMMNLAAREGDPVVNRIFEDIGASLAVIGEEIDWILEPAARTRMLFGRVVKKADCFELMRKGAVAAGTGVRYTVADEAMAETPLMRELGRSRDFTVAQFAQAVGAVYYANYRLRRG